MAMCYTIALLKIMKKYMFNGIMAALLKAIYIYVCVCVSGT